MLNNKAVLNDTSNSFTITKIRKSVTIINKKYFLLTGANTPSTASNMYTTSRKSQQNDAIAHAKHILQIQNVHNLCLLQSSEPT